MSGHALNRVPLSKGITEPAKEFLIRPAHSPRPELEILQSDEIISEIFFSASLSTCINFILNRDRERERVHRLI